MKRIALLSLLAFGVMSGAAYAYGHAGQFGAGHLDPSEESTLAEVSTFMKDLAVSYSHELERGALRADLGLYPGAGDDIFADHERRDQARHLARTALRAVVRETIEEVDLFHTIKTYGRRLTTTRIDISNGDIDVFGPSLREDRAEIDPIQASRPAMVSVRSGMSLSEGIYPVPMIQARISDLDSRLTYDPLSGGDWRFSLSRPISSQSAVEMIYSLDSTAEQNLVATLRIGF